MKHRRIWGVAAIVTLFGVLMGANVVNRFVGYVGGTARQYIVADVDASKPVAGVSVGDECYCKDTGYTYKWNGTAWQAPGMARADLQLVLTNTTTITSNPYGGTRAYINGEIVTITGLTCLTSDNVISSTGTNSGAAAAASTHYYVYRSNSSASYAPGVPRLCATAPSSYLGNLYLAAAGNGANWLYVGDCHTNGSTQYEWVSSFYNGVKSLVQKVTATGTSDWYPPYGWTACEILAISGGGAGGGGAGWNAQAGGGGGGPGGSVSLREITPSQVASFIRVLVGLGGVGGAGGVGADGTDGGATAVNTTVRDGVAGVYFNTAWTGAGGLKGTSAVGGAAGTSALVGLWWGTNGGAGHATAAAAAGIGTGGASSGASGGGGGAGHAGAASFAGGTGGRVWPFNAVAAAAGANGEANNCGPGSGGGGGNSVFGGAGQGGGTGGLYGGGGGGGGGGNATSGGGRGGDGGQGVVIFRWGL